MTNIYVSQVVVARACNHCVTIITVAVRVDAKGKLYVKCVKGMYGLPHIGIVGTQKLLEERLHKATGFIG